MFEDENAEQVQRSLQEISLFRTEMIFGGSVESFEKSKSSKVNTIATKYNVISSIYL